MNNEKELLRKAFEAGMDYGEESVTTGFGQSPSADNFDMWYAGLNNSASDESPIINGNEQTKAFCSKCNETGLIETKGDLHGSSGLIPCDCGAK